LGKKPTKSRGTPTSGGKKGGERDGSTKGTAADIAFKSRSKKKTLGERPVTPVRV